MFEIINSCPYLNVVAQFVDFAKSNVLKYWPKSKMHAQESSHNDFISSKIIHLIIGVLDRDIDLESGGTPVLSTLNFYYLLLKRESAVTFDGYSHNVGAWDNLSEMKTKFITPLARKIHGLMKPCDAENVHNNLSVLLFTIENINQLKL